MKCNKENKKKIYGLLHPKMHSIFLECGRDKGLEVWRAFCKSFGITEVIIRDTWHIAVEGGSPGNTYDMYDNPEANQKNIIINDPWLGDCNFLLIPIDVAEKFLVLGIP